MIFHALVINAGFWGSRSRSNHKEDQPADLFHRSPLNLLGQIHDYTRWVLFYRMDTGLPILLHGCRVAVIRSGIVSDVSGVNLGLYLLL
jgi:hypothetical protein